MKEVRNRKFVTVSGTSGVAAQTYNIPIEVPFKAQEMIVRQFSYIVRDIQVDTIRSSDP